MKIGKFRKEDNTELGVLYYSPGPMNHEGLSSIEVKGGLALWAPYHRQS